MKMTDLTDEERALLKRSLQTQMSEHVDDQLLDLFWSPFNSLTTGKEESFTSSERAALIKKIVTSGAQQRQSFYFFVIIAIIIFIVSFPYWFIGLLIDIVLLFIWAHLASKYLKHRLTSYDRFVLLDRYNERINQWNYEYLQLRESLYETVCSKDDVKRELFLREMCRYLKLGILVLDRPRLINNEPFSSA